MRIHDSSSSGYFIWVLTTRIFIAASASTYWNDLLPSHIKNTVIQPFEVAGTNDSISKQSISLASAIQPEIRKQQVKTQVRRAATTDYQDKLQKRGQWISSLLQNLTQNDQDRNGMTGSNRNTRARIQTSQASSSQTSSSRTSSSWTSSSQASSSQESPSWISSSHTRGRSPTPRLRRFGAPQSPRSIDRLASIPPPLKRTSSFEQLAKLKSLSPPKNLPSSTLSRKKSAPSLVDLPAIKAFAMREKAFKMRDDSDIILVKATDSFITKNRLPRRPYDDASRIERIKHFDRANTDGRAFARSAAKVSHAFAEATEASREANWPASVHDNELSQKAAKLTSDAWKAMAKSDSYDSQFHRTKLRDNRERQQLNSVLRQQDGRDMEIHRAIRASYEDSQRRLAYLKERYNDADRLWVYHSGALKRHNQEHGHASGSDSNNADGTAFNAPPPLAGNAIVRPFTPSPASSRGRSDTDERTRRKSTDSSSSSSSSRT